MKQPCGTCQGKGYVGAHHEESPCGCTNGSIFTCDNCLEIFDSEGENPREDYCPECVEVLEEIASNGPTP